MTLRAGERIVFHNALAYNRRLDGKLPRFPHHQLNTGYRGPVRPIGMQLFMANPWIDSWFSAATPLCSCDSNTFGRRSPCSLDQLRQSFGGLAKAQGQYVRNDLINLSGNNVTKDELRAELERQEQRFKDVYGGEITTYAAQPDPERKPWRKRATVQDQAFQQELQKIEQELKQEPAAH
jgi:hypothetical protein